LLHALPAPARRAFEQLAIVWKSTLPEPVWQRMCGTTDPAEAERLLRQWEPYLRPWESIQLDFHEGGLNMGFGTRCTPPTNFGGVPAFCNSVFISRPRQGEYDDQRLRLATDDGSKIPEDLMDTAAEVAAALTVAVPWRAGDVLVIDNTRFLHGRQAFTDDSRAVMVRMGFLREELTP
jgi:hypothetical protein